MVPKGGLCGGARNLEDRCDKIKIGMRPLCQTKRPAPLGDYHDLPQRFGASKIKQPSAISFGLVSRAMLVVLAATAFSTFGAAQDTDKPTTDPVKVGSQVPNFSVNTLAGKSV